MTLDGDLPRRERVRRKREALREQRRAYDEDLAQRKPWLFPLLLGSAIVVIIGVVVYWLATGN